MSPVYFGSALNQFGLTLLMNGFVQYAPNPQPRQAVSREVKPEESK